jgi:ribonucleoside-triphosphate reductase
MPYAAEEVEECVATEDAQLLLFTTKTCPKCRMAKMFLDNAGIEYTTLIAEENAELANAYAIKEAPTLVVVSGDKAEKIANPSNIKAFCEKMSVKA